MSPLQSGISLKGKELIVRHQHGQPFRALPFLKDDHASHLAKLVRVQRAEIAASSELDSFVYDWWLRFLFSHRTTILRQDFGNCNTFLLTIGGHGFILVLRCHQEYTAIIEEVLVGHRSLQ